VNGFLHYFFSVINPMMNGGFSRALPEVLSTPEAFPLLFAPVVVLVIFPSMVIWIVYLVRPDWIRPPLPAKQAEPLVSVVVAGRNESATIGECIRSALQCGYGNLEVIFVDDHSEDNAVAVARRAALGLTGISRDSERVRIFSSPRRNGKVSSLNIGIRMARGEYIAVVDADSTIEYGTIQHWLRQFSDPKVGAVCGNIRVKNANDNLLTRLQELEYAQKFPVIRLTLSLMSLISMVVGMGGIFRADLVRKLGGFDTGLGEDADMSMNLLKQRWKLAFSLDGVVWTAVPTTLHHLWRQRSRWARNTVKIRLSKHRDLFLLGRYGFANAIIALRTLIALPFGWVLLVGILVGCFSKGPLSVPMLIVSLYWITLFYMLIRMLISRDISRTPQVQHLWVIFLYPFYVIWLHLPIMYTQFCELFRIGAKHPYVPDHIWEEIPWW
jgi:cellulose synthase/poly-beta-1,6-N-acetylglucosamine synthase-like glycosyltransferase